MKANVIDPQSTLVSRRNACKKRQKGIFSPRQVQYTIQQCTRKLISRQGNLVVSSKLAHPFRILNVQFHSYSPCFPNCTPRGLSMVRFPRKGRQSIEIYEAMDSHDGMDNMMPRESNYLLVICAIYLKRPIEMVDLPSYIAWCHKFTIHNHEFTVNHYR